jgi:hypothetical protein
MSNHDSIRPGRTTDERQLLAQRLREHAEIHDQHVPHDDEQAAWAQDLRAAADIISTARTEHPDEAMFRAAISDLASISEALGLDPDAGGAAPFLDAIEQLRAAWPADSAALRGVVTAAQDLDENSEELELDDGAGRAAVLRHWHALDDALENLAEVLAKPRTCNNEACGWTGTTRRMLGAVGPLCPECGETTEEVSQPNAQDREDEKEQAVIEAAMEWWTERTVRDWGDIRLAKAVATLGGDWPGCDECDHQCGEDCRPMTVAEMHAAIDHQTADLIHAGILFADDEWTTPAGWKPSEARTRELLRTKIRYVFAPENPAARDVLAERQRQVSAEGWTPEHDDEHIDCSMSRAAACYALDAAGYTTHHLPFWPWEPGWWKPGGPRRNLVKAGALILAEIDRIDRAAARASKGE